MSYDALRGSVAMLRVLRASFNIYKTCFSFTVCSTKHHLLLSHLSSLHSFYNDPQQNPTTTIHTIPLLFITSTPHVPQIPFSYIASLHIPLHFYMFIIYTYT